MPWLRSLVTNRLAVDPPPLSRFICIGGQHRLLAARQIHNEWVPSPENQEMDPSLGFYPANIYESGQYTVSSLPTPLIPLPLQPFSTTKSLGCE
jgi:hypothetical protein